MNFTLVSTVFNEIPRLADTIADITAQSVQPTEIIITDAGSTDGTYERLLKWKEESTIPVTILQEKGCNVARGRNLAIEAAGTDLIVSTDFGCRFHPDWLKSLVEPFETDDSCKVAGGTYTVSEEIITTLPAKANYILTNGYKLDVSSWFIPSSRSIAYKTEAWEKVNFYPEWLTLAGDDLVFGMKLKAAGYTWTVVDKPYVSWLRHNKARGYVRESGRYGQGDGEAHVNVKNSLVLLLEVLLRLLLPVSLAGLVAGYPYFLITLIPSLAGFRPYYVTLKNWYRIRSPKYDYRVFFYSLVLLERNRFAYLNNYFGGYFSSNHSIKQGRKNLHFFLSKNRQL